MTDYSKMTDEELNEEIAVCLGNRILYEVGKPPMMRSHGRGTQILPVPDYTHDWRLAGELLEEMAPSVYGISVSLFSSDMKWVCHGAISKNSWLETDNCYTPQRAICEAWLAWKGAE